VESVKISLNWRLLAWQIGAVLTLASVYPIAAPAQVQINIDSSQSLRAISPYIYGANSSAIVNATLQRLGGNRWTAYNWENNASNAGSDYHFQNDNYLSSSTSPGAGVLPAIQTAASKRQALLLTIPTNGYVSADRLGNGDVRYPNGDTSQPKLSQSTVLATRFVPEYPTKPGGPANFTLASRFMPEKRLPCAAGVTEP
jgi:hypothetical protein